METEPGRFLRQARIQLYAVRLPALRRGGFQQLPPGTADIQQAPPVRQGPAEKIQPRSEKLFLGRAVNSRLEAGRIDRGT